MQRAIAPDEDLVVTSSTRNGYITSYGIPQLDWNTELFLGHIGMSQPRDAMVSSAMLPRTDGLVARQRGTTKKGHMLVYSQLRDALPSATPETILSCFAKTLCVLLKAEK
eukprot:4300288-Pleurochrysis_carterae.AAC.1